MSFSGSRQIAGFAMILGLAAIGPAPVATTHSGLNIRGFDNGRLRLRTGRGSQCAVSFAEGSDWWQLRSQAGREAFVAWTPDDASRAEQRVLEQLGGPSPDRLRLARVVARAAGSSGCSAVE